MSDSAIFKKKLCNPIVKPATILKYFSHFNHIVFLQNNEHPVIALLATEYFICQANHFSHFKQTSLGCYQEEPCNQLSIQKFQTQISQNQVCQFNGGLLGFISYDFATFQHISIKTKQQPSLFLGYFDSYIEYSSEGWIFCSHSSNSQEIFDYIKKNITHEQSIETFKLTSPVQARWSKQQYQNAFHKVQKYIQCGDCYQINLTQEFTAKTKGSLLNTADDFWALTNAPYAGYLRINDFELLSCSPELFIDFENNQKMTTKPIKGTMPRYADPILDEQSKNTLKHSKKDQAENVMIVDLLRNDLSVYAEVGSVKTNKLFEIESFNQVHHMVSEITATLKQDTHPFEVLMSALPGGSITGAPKIRAMQIIEELEDAPRGAYCGSLGYFNHDGTGSWNILIRSIQKFQDELSVWAGGGITIASDCDAEYQECFDKVDALLNLLNTYYNPE